MRLRGGGAPTLYRAVVVIVARPVAPAAVVAPAAAPEAMAATAMAVPATEMVCVVNLRLCVLLLDNMPVRSCTECAGFPPRGIRPPPAKAPAGASACACVARSGRRVTLATSRTLGARASTVPKLSVKDIQKAE